MSGVDSVRPPDPVVVEHFEARRRSMRIAIVTETWPPEVNGVAMSIARVVAGLQARDHSVQVVRPRQAADRTAAGSGGVESVLTRGLPIPPYPALRLGVPEKRTLVRLWSEHRPDVVHLATEGPLGWSALRAAAHLRLPTTSDFRTNFHAYTEHYGIGWLRLPIASYLRRFHNRTRLTMVPTQGVQRDLAALGFRNLEVVGRGVDTERFTPALRSDALRATWGADRAGDLVVAYVGRLAVEKNLDVLLDAFGGIRNRVPRARLLLVGDGPLRGEIRARCPDAIFAGQRTGEDLAVHYASADLFLFPSLTETFGNVTPEAMASGLPAVAFDYAAAAELCVDGETGCLVPFGDAGAFVRTSVALASDPDRRRRIADAARHAVTPCGWDRVVGRFESLLLALASPALQRSPSRDTLATVGQDTG